MVDQFITQNYDYFLKQAQKFKTPYDPYDILQESIMSFLEMPLTKQEELIETKNAKRYINKIIILSSLSKTSRYYYKYIKNHIHVDIMYEVPDVIDTETPEENIYDTIFDYLTRNEQLLLVMKSSHTIKDIAIKIDRKGYLIYKEYKELKAKIRSFKQ